MLFILHEYKRNKKKNKATTDYILGISERKPIMRTKTIRIVCSTRQQHPDLSAGLVEHTILMAAELSYNNRGLKEC